MGATFFEPRYRSAEKTTEAAKTLKNPAFRAQIPKERKTINNC